MKQGLMQQGLTEVTVRNVAELTDRNAELASKDDVKFTNGMLRNSPSRMMWNSLMN